MNHAPVCKGNLEHEIFQIFKQGYYIMRLAIDTSLIYENINDNSNKSWDQNVGSGFCKCHIHHNSAKINYKLVTLHMIRVLLPILFET